MRSTPAIPLVRARLVPLALALRGAWRNFLQDGGPDLSAAVAFYSLLSLPPLLYLTGAALAWTFQGSSAGAATLVALDRLLPPEVSEWVGGLDLGLRSRRELALVAFPAWLWSANRGFSSLGRALNVAFGVRRRRAKWIARVKGLGLMLAWLAFLTLSVAAGTVMPRVNAVLTLFGQPHLSQPVESVTAWVVAPALSLITFVLFYRLLPHVKVGWRPALSGAILAWLSWEGARRLFGDLLATSQTLGLVSGVLAGIITFLMWIYTTVAIVLVGAELAAVLDGHREAAPARTPSRADLSDPS